MGTGSPRPVSGLTEATLAHTTALAVSSGWKSRTGEPRRLGTSRGWWETRWPRAQLSEEKPGQGVGRDLVTRMPEGKQPQDSAQTPRGGWGSCGHGCRGRRARVGSHRPGAHTAAPGAGTRKTQVPERDLRCTREKAAKGGPRPGSGLGWWTGGERLSVPCSRPPPARNLVGVGTVWEGLCHLEGRGRQGARPCGRQR